MERNVFVAMAFREPFPIIYTTNVGRLMRFYVDAFGFSVGYRWPPEAGDADVEFANLTLGASSIGLGRPVDPLHGRPVAASSSPATFELSIETDDVDGAVESVIALGAELVLGAEDMPWGERMAYVADPDGHPIMLYAKLS